MRYNFIIIAIISPLLFGASCNVSNEQQQNVTTTIKEKVKVSDVESVLPPRDQESEVDLVLKDDSPPSVIDTDADGLVDSEEKRLGTDQNNPDTDSDGYSDSVELRSGYDPLVAAQKSAVSPKMIPEKGLYVNDNLGFFVRYPKNWVEREKSVNERITGDLIMLEESGQGAPCSTACVELRDESGNVYSTDALLQDYFERHKQYYTFSTQKVKNSQGTEFILLMKKDNNSGEVYKGYILRMKRGLMNKAVTFVPQVPNKGIVDFTYNSDFKAIFDSIGVLNY